MGESSLSREASVTDSDRLAVALRDPEARFVVFRGGDVLLETSSPIRPVLVPPTDLADLTTDHRAAVLLGTYEFGPRLALDLEDVSGSEAVENVFGGEFRSLSGIREPIESQTWALLSRARSLLTWIGSLAVCPRCGAATQGQEGGAVRLCTNAECGLIHYPRTDPTVIVRVVSGEKCLLARQPGHAPGLRSVIAGFVEPGETLENAVRREVAEEVGIFVERIVYLGSQPWPFPLNLMIAFEARARTETIHMDANELEAADWYTREGARREIDKGSLVLPSRKSIARRMIEDWLEDRDALSEEGEPPCEAG